MSINSILKQVKHRPWDLPTETWKYYQEWNNVVFLHWEVELNELKKFVPKELKIDLFHGKPYVSLVAFTMENIRQRNLPAFAPISNFNEINVRTYVRFNNKSGVYFLSIEASKLVSCKIAKIISELPYRYSKIQSKKDSFKSTNKAFNDKLDIEFEIEKKQLKKTDVDHWLTERYALFQKTRDTINEFDIHHLQWPIQDIRIKRLIIDYQRFNDLMDNKPVLCHYSKGVQVLAWKKNGHRLKQ